jgi:hypothetical protein
MMEFADVFAEASTTSVFVVLPRGAWRLHGRGALGYPLAAAGDATDGSPRVIAADYKEKRGDAGACASHQTVLK